MWLEIASGAILVADLVYHRITDEKGTKEKPEPWQLPRIDEGAPVPIVWGRYRVRRAIPAWLGKAYAIYADTDSFLQPTVPHFYYAQSSHWIIASGFHEGEQGFCGMWRGESKYGVGVFSLQEPEGVLGTGNFEPDTRQLYLDTINLPDHPYDQQETNTANDAYDDRSFGDVEFLNGNSSQKVVDDDGTPLTYLGLFMTTTESTYPEPEMNVSGSIDAADVPNYRGYLSAFLFQRFRIGLEYHVRHFVVGGSPQQPSLNFEVSSYSGSNTIERIGNDANPAYVIRSILTDPDKGAIDASYIDDTTFDEVAATLVQESHGFSYALEEAIDVREMLTRVLKQIDGAIYVDESVGKIKLRLIRNDFDPATIFQLTRDNCRIVNFSMSGWEDAVNKVTVVYKSREAWYEDRSFSATSLSGASAGRVREHVLQLPGVTYEALAGRIAMRELAWRGVPMMKCRALCDRSALRLTIGEPVRLTYSGPDIAGQVFRVAAVDRGTLDSNVIGIDLIQDMHYVYRGQPPRPFPEPQTDLIDLLR